MMAKRAQTSTTRTKKATPALDPALNRRVVIENVQPQVDCGRFPIKRVTGETVAVTADIHADGHDVLAAVLLYRRAEDESWREAPMVFVENDAWRGAFVVADPGRYEYTIEGWVDRFASWRDELRKKVAAGLDVASELLEGAALLERAGQDAHAVVGDASRPQPERVTAALSDAVAARRRRRTRSPRVDPLRSGARRPGRARTGALRRVVRDVPPVGRHRSGARRDLRRGGRRGCPTWPPWGSTCCTCRRFTRSGAASARGPTTR